MALDRLLQKEADKVMENPETEYKTEHKFKANEDNVKNTIDTIQTKEILTNQVKDTKVKQNIVEGNGKPVVKKEDIETDSLEADAQAIEKGKETKDLKPEQKEMLSKMNEAQIKFNTNMKENQTNN